MHERAVRSCSESFSGGLGYNPVMVLGLLIGNSSLRCGISRDGRIVADRRTAWTDRQGLAALGGWLHEQRVDTVILASVRDDLFGVVRDLLPTGLPQISVAGEDFPLAVENRYERPEEVGRDRLLNTLAAAERAGSRGAIVVDLGTATSFAAVGSDGAFLGGPICPGAQSLQAGLRQLTPALPTLQRAPDAGPFLATSTDAALRAGLFWHHSGGLQRLIAGIRDELAAEHGLSDPLLIATGGDAAAYLGALGDLDPVPTLTLEGLFLAWERRSRNAGAGS